MTSINGKKTKTSEYHRNLDKTTSALKEVNEINASSFLSRRKVTMGTFRAQLELSIPQTHINYWYFPVEKGQTKKRMRIIMGEI